VLPFESTCYPKAVSSLPGAISLHINKFFRSHRDTSGTAGLAFVSHCVGDKDFKACSVRISSWVEIEGDDLAVLAPEECHLIDGWEREWHLL
jgi:hypothetical protein